MAKFIFSTFIFSHILAVGIYTLSDLEYLSREQNSQEFLSHALDIRPSERSEAWSQMVQTMASLHIDKWISKKIFGEQEYLELEKYAEWPILKNHRPFHIKREEYLISFFKTCLQEIPLSTTCLTRIEKYYELSDKNIQLSVKLFKLLDKKKLPTWKYLQNISRSDQSLHYCKEKDIKEAIIKKIFTDREKDFKFIDNHKQAKKYLTSIVDDECWEEIKNTLKEYLFHPQYEIHHQTFLFLSSLKALIQTEEDVYYLYYILQGPVNGETFNLAWARLLELSQNSKRREKAIEKILTIDPLPGKIFGIADYKRRKIIIDYLQKTVPDYLDAYARACVDYREGKREFPNGNPTLHCHELMNDNDKNNWVSESLVIRFSATVRGPAKGLKVPSNN